MIIDRKIDKYIIFNEDPIRRALEKIDTNDMRVIFVVDETGMLEGMVTDGDFRRWVMQQQDIDLSQSISCISNTTFKYSYDGEELETITSLFSERIDFVPLVDEKMHLVAVATKRKPVLTIGHHRIAADLPTFIIAEIGNNHNGSIGQARKLVDAAVDAGADCVKFQMRDIKNLYSNEGKVNDAEEDLGSQYVLDLLNKFQLTNTQLLEIFDYCKEMRITPLCTPWDEGSVAILDKYGLEGFKVASADFTNHDLLACVARKGKPMICSTGMCTEQEIKVGVSLLQKLGAQFVLLHCNSTYPSPFKDINLNYLDRLQAMSDFPVGYSGHERGSQIAIAAVSMGARVIEKHLTLDRSMEGNDHKVSLLPHEFKDMVAGIRQVELALGTGEMRTITQGELINRESLAKSVVINCDISEGEIITAEMLEVKSPGKGLAPYRKKELIGTPVQRNMLAGTFFYPEDLDRDTIQPREFHFVHPYGVPVRYHDIMDIVSRCPMNLLEIHLSYKDLEENIDSFFDKSLSHQLVVHSPELFSGDHILDLSSSDEKYRQKSIKELQRVITITKELKQYFPNCQRPLIVVNVGGFSADAFIPKQQRSGLYERLLESLKCLDQEEIELIPQTMPPYPWHFGGQRFHNLFVDLDEILDFCIENKYRVCLDLSHSKLACTYNNESFLDFLEKVSPVTAHMHIADAKGEDGEGLQIGEGELDFAYIMSRLKKWMPEVSFIPEIWQGHKNRGQGFWVALDRLEKACH